MSAVVACACGSSHLCGCGCGRPLNPNIRAVHALAAKGLRNAEIALRLGISADWVKNIKAGRNVPKFLKGHWTSAQPKPVVPCANCGKPFRKMGPNHRYCTSASSAHGNPECSRLSLDAKQHAWEEYHRAVRDRADAREALAQGRRLLRALVSRETDPEWYSGQLAEIRLNATDELRLLIDEQERDGRFGHAYATKPWERSLDVRFDDGAALLDFVDERGSVVFGQRHTIDFTDALVAVMDRKREIDAWAQEAA